MKKQTAVEWLVEQIKKSIDPEDGSISINWLHDETINQAKEMEKQQIIDARVTALLLPDIDKHVYVNEAEQYYDKTFKSE